MAGAFTHFLISDFAKAEFKSLPSELWQLLNKHAAFLFLGSVSPDIPYLSFKTGTVKWADVMHYEKTNSVAQSGQDLLRSLWTSKKSVDEAKLVWLLGYISHLVTDATIHPIVQAIVGPYASNPEEHRLCEMTQDSLLYYFKKQNDIKYADFSAMIAFCKKSEFFDEVMGFWKGLLLANYADKNEEPHPELWFLTYSQAIDLAEGDGAIFPLFRHIGLGQIAGNYSYHTHDDIEQNTPQYKEKYFDKIKLPTGGIGFFPDDGYKKAVTNVLAAWNGFFRELGATDNISDLVRNWDLDTGVDMNSPNQTVTYWS
jgi:hypothetical protein